MNKKILFFTDGWFINFGVAKYFHENNDFDLYALFDVDDKAKKFFKNQDIVKYKKIWFLMDFIEKKYQKPDFDYLSSFEEKYNINLWDIAYNDRAFYKYNHFHQFTDDEILLVIEQECRLFEQVLDESKPDFLVLMLSTTHYHELLRRLCIAKGIEVLMLGSARFRNSMIITNEFGTLDSEEDKKIIDPIPKLENPEEFLKKYDAAKQQDEFVKSQFQSHTFERYLSILKFFLSGRTKTYKNRYVNYGRTKTRVLRHKIFHLFRKKYRGFFINRNFIKKINRYSPFIYFPLQMEPERVLLISSKYYNNQIAVISNIAKSIPVGYKLLVKEHPTQKIWGWRSVDFYKQIMNLPNVRLIHPSIKGEEMLKRCSLVITISGTAAQEAAFYQKPSITFVDLTYVDLPSVHKIEKFQDLPNAIKSSLEKEVNNDSANKYVKVVKKNAFDFNLIGIAADFSYRFGFKGPIMDAELPTENVMKFLKDYETPIKNLSLEHIKKIKNHIKSK